MTILEIILLILVLLLGALLSVGLYYGLRAGRRILATEYLFSDTLEEMEYAYEIFFNLTKRSSMMTDHPDIKNLEQVMLLVLNILERYLRDGKQITSNTTKQKEGKE